MYDYIIPSKDGYEVSTFNAADYKTMREIIQDSWLSNPILDSGFGFTARFDIH